jgi:hypothetical protein
MPAATWSLSCGILHSSDEGVLDKLLAQRASDGILVETEELHDLGVAESRGPAPFSNFSDVCHELDKLLISEGVIILMSRFTSFGVLQGVKLGVFTLSLTSFGILSGDFCGGVSTIVMLSRLLLSSEAHDRPPFKPSRGMLVEIVENDELQDEGVMGCG